MSLRLRSFPASSIAFFMAFSAMNVSNFAFHMVTSRVLEPPAYGALGALLSIMLVLQVPVNALQVAITQQVAAHRAADPFARLDASRLLIRMVVLAAIAAIAFTVISPLLKAFLHLDSVGPVLLLALDMFPLVIGLVPRALFLGEQRFRPVSLALVVGAVVRLATGYCFGQFGWGTSGAMLATVLGDTVMAAVLLWPMLRDRSRFMVDATASAIADNTRRLAIDVHDARAAGIAFAGLFVLIGTDTVLARHYLSELSSAVYVAASTAGRAALFSSAAVGLIVFPRFAAYDGEGPLARKELLRALLIVVVLGAVAALFIGLFPGFYLSLLFGEKYKAAGDIAGMLAAGSALLGVSYLLVYFQLSRRTPAAWFAWVAVAALLPVIALFHGSAHTIAVATVVTTSILMLIALAGALRATRRESQVRLAQEHRPPPPEAEGEIHLTVVVPFYNPGPRFVPSLERLVSTLRDEDIDFEVIAVSDGSTDGSAEALRELTRRHNNVVRTVVLERNWGKGEALRVGLSLGRGRHVGFIDADGDIDASLFHPYMALVRLYDPDIVLGSKRHPMSDVEYPIARRVYSWGYQQLMKVLFNLEVRDTQTGIKILRRDVLAAVLPRMVERGFAFDLELFVVARRLGYRKLFEAPVRIGTRFTSTISRRAAFAMFRDTFKIFYRLRILRAYDYDAELEILLNDPQTPRRRPSS